MATEAQRRYAAMYRARPLPWNIEQDSDPWTIVDANHRFVCSLDDNLSFEDAHRLSSMLLVGVNTCGGYPAHEDGTFTEAP